MQTADTGTFPRQFLTAFNQIKSTEGWNGLYKGLKPLWMR